MVLIEFLNQGRLEKEANLPVSPNMDEETVNQIESQLSFVELIVEPLFGCFVELFPRTLSLMDLIADNSRLWISLLEKSQKLHISTNIPAASSSSPNSSHTPPFKLTSPLTQARKLSFAAGTIEIPGSVNRNSYSGRYRSLVSHRSSHKENSDTLKNDELREEAEP